MGENMELGLETLLAVRRELEVSIEDELLIECFKIQKKYQFSRNRDTSMSAMNKVIDKYVEKISRSQKEDEK